MEIEENCDRHNPHDDEFPMAPGGFEMFFFDPPKRMEPLALERYRFAPVSLTHKLDLMS
jgi:hypothetical protein